MKQSRGTHETERDKIRSKAEEHTKPSEIKYEAQPRKTRKSDYFLARKKKR